MKIALLVAYCDSPPFNLIRDSGMNQHLSNIGDGSVDVFFVKGKKASQFTSHFSKFIEDRRFTKLGLFLRFIDSVLLLKYRFLVPQYLKRGCEISVNCPDELRYLGAKMLAAYKYCLMNDYDYVFKTTVSSVVNVANLKKYLETKMNVNYLYAGRVINPSFKPFASGACLLMSRGTLELLLGKRARIDHSLLDDVAIGKVLRSCKVPLHSLPSLNLGSIEEVHKIDNSDLVNYLHFRCKSSGAIRNDIEVISVLLVRLNSLLGLA